MVAEERTVAGLRCTEVLERLSAYLDRELLAGEVASVEAHLRGCDWCERFGTYFGTMVGTLRRELTEPAPLPDDVRARLLEALRPKARPV